MSETEFKPTDRAREIYRGLAKSAQATAVDGFFDMWEAEGDPRRAGSMAAHIHITNGARVAVFGAMCAGDEPRKDLWMACCEAAYDAAIKDVSDAFDQADNEKPAAASTE